MNAYLVDCCRRRMADRLRGRDETIAQRLERDLAAFQRPLPPAYDACEKVATRVSSLSLVRYRLNDYSVPTTYGHRDVLVRGYVHDVVISCGAEVIARHPRSYERHDFIFDPLHYLALIEQKINALDQAAPLAGWRLPEEFMALRRLLEARMGKQGKREFVQVLRLMEVFPLDDVAAAARDAIARGAIGFDAVKHHPVPHRTATAAPRHDDLSLSAAGAGHDDVGEHLHELADGGVVMTDTPQLLLGHHLKALKLPTFLREYEKLARQCAAEGLDHVRFLLRLVELELIDRERRMVERRIKEARFPAVKSLDNFDFAAIVPSAQQNPRPGTRPFQSTRPVAAKTLSQSATAEPARRTHRSRDRSLRPARKGLSVGFYAAAALVHELLEARDEKRLLRLQRQVAGYKLLIIDELGYVPSLPDRGLSYSCSRYSASAMSAVQPSSHRTCHSTNGPQRVRVRAVLTGALL